MTAQMRLTPVGPHAPTNRPQLHHQSQPRAKHELNTWHVLRLNSFTPLSRSSCKRFATKASALTIYSNLETLWGRPAVTTDQRSYLLSSPTHLHEEFTQSSRWLSFPRVSSASPNITFYTLITPCQTPSYALSAHFSETTVHFPSPTPRATTLPFPAPPEHAHLCRPSPPLLCNSTHVLFCQQRNLRAHTFYPRDSSTRPLRTHAPDSALTQNLHEPLRPTNSIHNSVYL